ncbi:lipopolysaccharide biosynthesis protein, partial [Senegalimassilia anaerobia]|uniref:lipopolysaccharide biosynthesis protein n=1 Tax=Senegalimassilia anaerobia TaxID=1473216 RepID=UPI0026EEC759
MNNYEHTGSSAGKHAAQRPDLERVQLNAAESPYPTAPRNVREEQRAQAQRQRAAAVAKQASRSAATTQAIPGQQQTQAIPGQQPTQAIPGQQPTEAIGGERRGKHGRARNAQQVRNNWDAQPTQAVYGQQPTQAIPGQQPTAAMPGAQATEAMPRGKHGKRSRNGKPRKKSFVTRKVEAWCSRVLGAVSGDGLAEQEAEYASGRTTRDYVWNSVGVGLWGMVFPVLTIVVTQLAGAEQAGMFSLAFVTALLLMFVGNYGVRNFQASDLDEEYSFADYQANRVLTVVIMLVAGITYCKFRGYTDQMWLMSLGVYLYKAVDALADVYEGRLQQVDKLYLAGISQAFRSAAALIGFSLALLITRNVGVSSIVMAVIAALTFVVFTFPLAQLETPKSRSANAKRVIALLKQCFPLFVALFMYNLIDNMPKFVMEGALSYDNQLYYNALYFPAHAILLTSGFIYKPMLLKMANAWADPAKRKKFDLIIVVMFVIIVAITVVVAGAMGWFGLTIMSFLYSIDFEQYRGLCFVMLAAGGVTAGIEFLYQVITVLRRQRAVTKLYLITFGFSLFVPVLLVNFTGLPGAVIGYLIVMCILLVLLVSEYASIRMDLHRKLTGKAAPDAEMPRAARTAAMAPVQVAGAGEQAAAGVVPQAAVAPMQAQRAEAPAEANAAARGAHAPKEPMANAPVEASADGNPTPDRSTAAGDADRQAFAPARLFVPEVYDTAPISWTAGGTV